MPQSDLGQERTENHMATSSLKNSQGGGKSNTSDKQVESLNEEIANLLVEYAELGGQVSGITLPEGKQVFGTRHVLILPATRKGSVYSLAKIGENDDTRRKTNS